MAKAIFLFLGMGSLQDIISEGETQGRSSEHIQGPPCHVALEVTLPVIPPSQAFPSSG
jgi:hypothetical protein